MRFEGTRLRWAHRTERHAGALASTLTLAAMLVLATPTIPLAQAQTFTVLYSFAGYPTDGGVPVGGLLMDSAGNLYGTTAYGGNAVCSGSSGTGCGTVFELDTGGTETVLHNFTGPDGANPTSNLIMDATGNLYGTTTAGGLLTHCTGFGSYPGCGVVFKLSEQKETVLHRFTGGGDGADPWRGVVMDASGALYGTTNGGGSGDYGVVFKLVGKKETVLHRFKGFPDGAYPTAGLIIDSAGNLYGTASLGGYYNCDSGGCGVVFKLTGKKNTILHIFKNAPPDGAYPDAALFMDAERNLYGTTAFGGDSENEGTVFEVSRHGKESVLYKFKPHNDGYRPGTRVIRDAAGNFYGTTLEGGTSRGWGIVFEISTDGKEKILHKFCSEKNCADGTQPAGDLIMDAKGTSTAPLPAAAPLATARFT